MTEQQKKKANGRYEGTNYRYSDKFIRVMTGWLIAWIFIGVGLGFGLGMMGSVFFPNSDAPAWYTTLAIGIAVSGVGLPLLVGAWLGASALNKYAGPVGLLLCFGVGALVYGKNLENHVMWTWIGFGSLVLSVGLFFLIGYRAKVAIWLQLPVFHSPHLYISKGEPDDKKKIPTNKK
jgi:hypothetical protein